MDAPTSRPSLLVPLMVLTACAVATATLLLLGSTPIIMTEDVVLHGGWSLMLMLGGCLALRYATGVLAKAEEWMVFLGVLALGLGLEVVQHYWRIDSTVGDVAIDTVGATAGWAFWRVAVAIEWRRKRQRAEPGAGGDA